MWLKMFYDYVLMPFQYLSPNPQCLCVARLASSVCIVKLYNVLIFDNVFASAILKFSIK